MGRDYLKCAVLCYNSGHWEFERCIRLCMEFKITWNKSARRNKILPFFNKIKKMYSLSWFLLSCFIVFRGFWGFWQKPEPPRPPPPPPPPPKKKKNKNKKNNNKNTKQQQRQQQQQQQQQHTNCKYISQNKGHAYILYPSWSIQSQVVEFISSEDFKEKRDCPSDLLAPIETMKRTKSTQVKKAVDKKKNRRAWKVT